MVGSRRIIRWILSNTRDCRIITVFRIRYIAARKIAAVDRIVVIVIDRIIVCTIINYIIVIAIVACRIVIISIVICGWWICRVFRLFRVIWE